MSHGPGCVQRAILDMIATPEAMASCTLLHNDQPGPVGVPIDAVFVAVYGPYEPTRPQRVAVFRAIRILTARGLVDTYSRRVCPTNLTVAAWVPWDEATQSYGCCGYNHRLRRAIGRPPTDDEKEAQCQRIAAAMALLRAL
jgi:hypothetical protein